MKKSAVDIIINIAIIAKNVLVIQLRLSFGSMYSFKCQRTTAINTTYAKINREYIIKGMIILSGFDLGVEGFSLNVQTRPLLPFFLSGFVL